MPLRSLLSSSTVAHGKGGAPHTFVKQDWNRTLPAGTSLGSFARAEDLFGIKRTQLKHKADQGVSEKQGMEAVHVSLAMEAYTRAGQLRCSEPGLPLCGKSVRQPYRWNLLPSPIPRKQ